MSLRFNLLLEQATLRDLLAICWLSVGYLVAVYSQATEKLLSIISFDDLALTQSSKNISSSIRDSPL